MIPFGYLVILGLLAGLTVLCFIWGVWEYKRPKNPGPLYIDLDRTIDERKEAPKIDKAADSEASNRSRKPSHRDELSELIQWNPLIDEIINEKFDKRSRIWMQEAETIRVRGDARIPKGEVISYNMIVEGNLISEGDVTFLGGLHVKGRAIIGARNLLGKSIVCERELVLLEDVIVRNCVDCEGSVFIKRGARIGISVEGGGIASGGTICLEKAEGPLKIYSKKGIRIVESLKEVVPDYLKPNVEVVAT